MRGSTQRDRALLEDRGVLLSLFAFCLWLALASSTTFSTRPVFLEFTQESLLLFAETAGASSSPGTDNDQRAELRIQQAIGSCTVIPPRPPQERTAIRETNESGGSSGFPRRIDRPPRDAANRPSSQA